LNKGEAVFAKVTQILFMSIIMFILKKRMRHREQRLGNVLRRAGEEKLRHFGFLGKLIILAISLETGG